MRREGWIEGEGFLIDKVRIRGEKGGRTEASGHAESRGEVLDEWQSHVVTSSLQRQTDAVRED